MVSDGGRSLRRHAVFGMAKCTRSVFADTHCTAVCTSSAAGRCSLCCLMLAGMKHLFEAGGAELRYLGAYSSDINRIEELFTRIKALLRKLPAEAGDDQTLTASTCGFAINS
jgi:hypothetical protein